MVNRICQTKAEVIKNIAVGPQYYKVTLLYVPAKNVAPGQFVMVKVALGQEPLLRRPFSIHSVGHKSKAHDTIEILYEVVGKGSQILSKKKPGEYLDVIGPLGNGFNISAQCPAPSVSILVAGGMGVAPLFFLAETIVGHKVTKSQSHKMVVLIGARNKEQILCEKEFKGLGCDVKIATDDGSLGFHGRVTELLENILVTKSPALPAGRQSRKVTSFPATIYACGPRAMLRQISRISSEYGVPAQISLEEHMACGIGACLGCAVKVKDTPSHPESNFKYLRVCKDGPVFDASVLIWQKADQEILGGV